MVFLSGIGVSTSLAVRIYKAYAEDSISVVRGERYRLASDVWGIGFKTADTIAQAVGIPHDSPERIKAGLQYTLSEAADNGHCYLPEPDLVREATKILQVDQELIGPCLDALAAEEGVVREQLPASDDPTRSTVPAVYLVPFHRPERSLTRGWDLGRAELKQGAAARVHPGRLADGAGLATEPDRPGPRARPATGGQARAYQQGRGVDRRAGVRQELHRPLGCRARYGQESHDRAGCAPPVGRPSGWPS
jgi:Helix-hairpin-helix containing domain